MAGQVFGVDLRTLAALRMALASLVLADLVLRARDLTAHYTDSGVLSRAALLEAFASRWDWSIHLMSGSVGGQVVLFTVAAAVAVAMLVGYKTRFFVVVTWVLLSSLQDRNPLVNGGADDALRVFVFWSMFLPMGARWSVDSRLGHRPERDPHVSWGSAAFMIQIAVIYLTTVIFKSDPAWRTDFTAVHYALHIDDMATWLGRLVRQSMGLTKAITIATLVLELVAPILVFLPAKTGRLRLAIVASMMALHLGMGLCLRLGLFPYVMWAGWLIFVPAMFWDRLVPSSRRPAAVATLPGARSTRLVNIVAALLIAYVVMYNVRALKPDALRGIIPRPVDAAARILNLPQTWGFFSPRPSGLTHWYVFDTELRNGETVDSWRHGAPVSWEQPDEFESVFPNYRWQFFFMTQNAYRRQMPLLAEYLCRTWNETHLGTPRMAETIDVYVMKREARLDGPDPTTKEHLARRACP